MRRINKHEKRILLNLKIISFLCIVSIALNVILPFIEQKGFSFFLLSQFAAIGAIQIYGWISSRNSQSVPITAAFIIRTLQALVFVFWRKNISLPAFAVLVFLDVLLLILLVLDKSNYKYTFVRLEEDEFFDK